METFLGSHDARPRDARASSPDAGFSLTELLIAVAIAIVVSAVALTQGNQGMRLYRLQQSTSMVAGKLAEARINALKRNRATWVQFDAAARTVQVQMNGPGGAVENIGPAGTLSTGVNFGSTAPVQVQYDALGRLAATQSVPLRDANGTIRIVDVAITGTMTVR